MKLHVRQTTNDLSNEDTFYRGNHTNNGRRQNLARGALVNYLSRQSEFCIHTGNGRIPHFVFYRKDAKAAEKRKESNLYRTPESFGRPTLQWERNWISYHENLAS